MSKKPLPTLDYFFKNQMSLKVAPKKDTIIFNNLLAKRKN